MASQTASSPSSDLLRRSLYFPLGLAAVYITFFLALLTPFFQRHFIFLHSISFPFFPTYHQPERYGLAPHKTRPFHLTTSDGERIGVWHVLPEIFYQTHLNDNSDGEWTDEVYAKALREYPTVLYLHGNSMNRAAPWRIAAYSALTSRIDANVVAIDYRGFGDSTGTPSEEGLVEDAYTAYQWILSQSSPSSPSSHAQPAGITIFGQSLGTGITALLAHKLELTNTPTKGGIVLMAPYTDLQSLVKDFSLAGILPLLKPIAAIPFNKLILTTFLKTQLNTLATLPKLNATPVVLLHAKDDPVIPIDHSRRLFEATTNGKGEMKRRSIEDYAEIIRFASNKAEVTLIETVCGGHNQLTEGALDLVRLALRLPSHLSPTSS